MAGEGVRPCGELLHRAFITQCARPKVRSELFGCLAHRLLSRLAGIYETARQFHPILLGAQALLWLGE